MSSSSYTAPSSLPPVPEKQQQQREQHLPAPQTEQPLLPSPQQRSPLLSASVESPPSSPELLSKDRPRFARKGRQCDACHTTETPMWRRGGKGTLCNACGVRWSLRKKRPPRPGLEGDTGGEALSPLPELSDDPATGSMLDDEATDPAIAALRSKRESDKDYYYCRYCDKTWPLNYFRNSQQFGAHCSNCSRKKRPSPNGEPTEAANKPKKRERRERKKARREREPISAAPPYWSEGEASSSPASSPAVRASAAAASALSSSPLASSTSTSSPASRKRERDHSGGEGVSVAMTKRRAKYQGAAHTGNGNGNGNGAAVKRRSTHGSSSGGSSGGDSDGEDDGEDVGGWERLFEKLKGNVLSSGSSRSIPKQAPAPAAMRVAAEPPVRVLSEEERRREVELLEKEVTLLRYQVRLKEHWHKKSLKEVKHNMEEELHELQKDLIYSFEVAQACIKLELESNEKEETQVLLAFARQVSLPPTPQPQSPQQQQQQQQHHQQQTTREGSAIEAGSTSSSGTCTPCHENLDKLRQDGEQLRRSCSQQLAKLKTELEQQFNAKEETFTRMLGETKAHFCASTQRLRKKIAEIESIILTLRTSVTSTTASTSTVVNLAPSPPVLSVAACQ